MEYKNLGDLRLDQGDDVLGEGHVLLGQDGQHVDVRLAVERQVLQRRLVVAARVLPGLAAASAALRGRHAAPTRTRPTDRQPPPRDPPPPPPSDADAAPPPLPLGSSTASSTPRLPLAALPVPPLLGPPPAQSPRSQNGGGGHGSRTASRSRCVM